MAEPTVPCTLSLEIERKAGLALVRCHGRLVAEVSGNFHARIKQLLPEYKRVVLDLSDLSHMDSMGLGALVRLQVSARSAGCSLELYKLGKQIRNLLGLTHLLSVFTVLGEQGVTLGF